MKPSEQALARTEENKTRPPASLAVRQTPIWVDAAPQRVGGIASYLEIPFIHKRLIIVCTLLGMLLGWAAILVWPRSYESEAKLIIRVGRESVSLDPTATTSATTLMMQKTQEAEIISALEMLNSQRIAETVVDELGAEAVFSGVLQEIDRESSRTDFEITVESLKGKLSEFLQNALLYAGIKDEIGDRELAVAEIQSSVWNYSPRKSNVIVIEAQSRTPEMAQAIVQQFTESFSNAHLERAHTKGSHRFFQQQSANVEAKLNQLVKERSLYMQKHKIISLDANRTLLEKRISGVDRDLMVASGQLEQAIAKVADLDAKVAGADDEVVAKKVGASDVTWSGMRQQVYELELEEQSLAASYTGEHPKLKSIRKQLAGAHRILAASKSERIDASTTPNPVKTRLREELQKQQTQIVGLRSMIEENEKLRVDLDNQADELLGYERKLTQTDRDIRIAESSLQMLREKQEESRVLDELHSDKFSNIHLFQPATFVERAVSPRKKPLAAGFLFLGLMTGLGLSVLRQASSSTIRTTEDVESQLGCPVVSDIPRLRRMESPGLKEQKLHRQKCQSLIAEVLLSQRLPRKSRGRSLGVIGVDTDAGASTLAVNLAVASGSDCRMRTVLVDADSRKRSVSRTFGLNGAPGLVELLNGNASHDECLQRAKNSPIDLIASAADSCDEMLTSNAAEIAQALQAYLQDCDLLIVDLPAASQPDQAVTLAQHLDCVLVVVESEKTLTSSAERLLLRLSESDTEVVGVVLNKTHDYLPQLLRRFVAPQA